ncbi:MAG: tRNA uridine-5-carboxymethylaminomethyl(34) synthesis GTPase MnmE [Pseudomonadota bacterium]
MASDEPIAAIATPLGRGGIGVIRVSGADLSSISQALLGRVPPARRAVLTVFRDVDGGAIDEGLALYFPAPHSYTGEDVLELHGHGGVTVMNLLLRRCLEAGARMAEPGEFSKRAFLKGKLDLAQAESVADLIDASTAEAARSAVRSLRGEFSHEVARLRDGLIELRALTEATLDFPDEEVDFLQAADAFRRLDALASRLDELLANARQGALLREGAHVVLVGMPNVGKSSLLNRLAREELAIVTDVPGTTRDTIRTHIQIDGVPFHVIDTAGLRDTQDAVERIGIERALAAAEAADLILVVTEYGSRASPEDEAILARLPQRLPRILVRNKIDLEGLAPAVHRSGRDAEVWLSAKSGDGVALLQQELLRDVGWTGQGEGVFMARERHLAALRAAAAHLALARERVDRLELFAEELRLAHDALGRITGEFTPDDLLGEIFGRFCIGK